MKIHKEGWSTIILVGILLCIINGLMFYAPIPLWVSIFVCIISIPFYYIIIYFFRNPIRGIAKFDNHLVYAPADGKLVVIEEVEEPEYFKDKRLQLSIFMSPLNVHVNRYPFSGVVKYFKYHPGKYLVAWHPKSSTLNERTTIVVRNDNGTEILIRQIAGAMARRIVCYANEGLSVNQGEDLGFIKFGSRVDVFLPLNTKVNVVMNQIIKGNTTILAQI